MRGSLIAIALLAAVAGASHALAGSSYPVIITGGTYSPLGDAGAPVPGVTGTAFGIDAIALNGWTFPYFDAGYSEITVTADGFLIVGDGFNLGCTPDAGGDQPFCADPSTFCAPSTGNCSTGCCAQIPNACINFSSCGGGCCFSTSSQAPGEDALGPSSEALGTIAAWWDTLDDTSVNGISYLQGGTTGNHFLTVDYHGIRTGSNGFFSGGGLGGSIYNFSITLNESGFIQMAYGTTTAIADAGGPDQNVVWVSLENPLGNTWIPGLGCDVDGGFSFSGFNEPGSSCDALNGDFPSNSDITFGSPPGVYLAPESIVATNGSVDGGVLSFSIDGLAGDLGQTAVATAFPYNVYLVQNLIEPANLPACPGGAGCLGTFQVTGDGGIPVIPAQSAIPLSSGLVSTPYPPAGGPGTYYVELWLDPADTTGNTSSAVGLSPPLLVGVELSGSVNVAMTATPPLVPGTGTFAVPITLKNAGLLSGANVEYQLWLTAANTAINPTTDFKVEDTTINLAGGADINQSDTATTLNATQGTYYLALVIDPNGTTPGNLDPDFITFSAGQVTVSPAHLKVTALQAPAEAFAGFETHVGYTISNDGADPATGFSIGLLIHPQARGSSFTINDPQLLEIDNVTIPAGCTVQAEDAKILTDTPVGCATFPTAAADGGVLQSVMPATMYGTNTVPGDYLVGVVADLYSQVNETRNANRLASTTPTVVFPPEPDFAVGPGDVTAPSAAAAGDRIFVDRQIHNVGIAAGSAPYSYFLSAVGQANTSGIPVPVVLPNGTTTFLPTTLNLAPPGQGISDDLGSDILALPTTLPPGNYTLALIVDPEQQTPELSTANDTATAANPIAIIADGLQIASSNLPTALVQVPYAYQLTATGALAATSWSLISGSLPTGLSLSAAGAISGTPTSTGTSTFVVQVSATPTGGTPQTQIAALDITVAQASGPLQVLTNGGAELPPATVGRAYTLQLAAEGGVPPYVWQLKPGNTLPGSPDLVLEPSGLIAGTPTQASASATAFTVIVSDQAGNTSQAALKLQIVDQGTLVITTTSLAPVTVGQGFTATIDATENDNLMHSYTWSLPIGQTLPPGVTFQSQGTPALGELSGTPTLAGTWAFLVLVTDEHAHTASRQLILQVLPQLLSVPAQSLPPATAGQAYTATIQVTGNDLVTFTLYSGDLPPGLALAPSGAISGTVDPASDGRTFAFTVLAVDSQGNQALVPLSILVQSTAAAKSGCSTGAGGASWLVLALGLLLLRRRKAPLARFGRAGFLGLVAILFVPGQAWAWNYTVAQSSTTFNDISSAPGVVTLDNSNTSPIETPTAFPVTLPFQFPFDVSSYSALEVWSNGALTFDSGAGATSPPVQDDCGGFPYSGGSCPPPTTLVAPWFGDLTVCYNATIAYVVAGASGSRTVTIQWTNVNTDDFCEDGVTSNSLFTFQVVLHEGSGDLDFIYGPSTQATFAECFSSSTGNCIFAGGIEDGPGGTPDLSCNAQCSTTDFPASGTEFSFSQQPDVQITQVQTPGSGVQGGNLLVTVQLDNKGGLPGNNGTGSLYFSADGQTFDAGSPLSTFGPFTVAAATTASIQREITVPATAALGTGWIIATISVPGDADPTGKQVASAGFDIFGAEADLQAGLPDGGAGLTAPTTGTAGSPITVGVTVTNVGSAPAANVPYSYYLSSSPTVSLGDLQIGSGTINSLAAGAVYTKSDQVQLPASLPAGTYTVGVIVNPAKTVPEYSFSNNSAIATPPIQVSAGALAVSTTQVPAASVGAPYQTVLTASGGGGAYSWSLTAGTLPPGIALTANGTVSGTPSTAGDNPVTVKVTDQNAATATAMLDFKVSAQSLPLAVSTNSLPGGSFGASYSVALVAIGGAPPYQWSIVAGGGNPPPGISVSTDGTLAGAPEADGAFVFTVQVQDSASTTAQSTALDLQVLSPGSVSVAQAQLPSATEGTSYASQLLGAGGTPPYSWSLLDDQQLPSGPGDQGQDLKGAMPGGLSLDPSGNVSGIATVTGSFALTVQVTDSSSPPVSSSDTVLLPVLPGNALQISNPTVPDATVGKPYIDTLDTNASNATVTFAVIDGLGDESDAARQSLPPGLFLDPTGVLEGTPAASAAGTTSKTYDFLVKASDGTGRIAVTTISLTVDPPASGGGCGSAAGEPGGLVAAALGLIFVSIRRKRSA